MRYLILSTLAAAEARSRAAYAALLPAGAPGGVTDAVWPVRAHPTEPWAALAIPDTPEAAGLGIDQAGYDALLTGDEQAALAGALDAGWLPEAAS